MPQFNSKEEYEKWKAERAAKAKGSGIGNNDQATQPQTTSKKTVIAAVIIAIVLTAALTAIIFKATSSSRKHEDVSVSMAPTSPSNTKTLPTEQAIKKETKMDAQVGRLSGNVYASMQSGDVKRAAGIEVFLIKDENSLMDVYQKMKETCKNEVHPIVRDKNYHSGFGGEEDRRRRQHVDQIFAICEAKIKELLLKNTVQKTNTDVNGFFEFTNIPFGKYYVISKFDVFSQQLEWLEPADINSTGKELKIDLSNRNSRNVFSF